MFRIMRSLILLLFAFLTALAGVGSVAHAAVGSPVVVSASEAEPVGAESVGTLADGHAWNAPPELMRVDSQQLVRVLRPYPLFADRLRL